MEPDELPHIRCVSIIDDDACYILFKKVESYHSALFHFDPHDHWDIHVSTFHSGIRRHILQLPDAHTHIIMQKSFDSYDLIQLRILQVTSRIDIQNVKNEYHWVNFANAISMLKKQHDENIHLQLMKTYLQSYLLQLQTTTSIFNSIPWYNHGFYKSILPWIQTTLQDRKVFFSTNPEQYYISFRSVIYEIKTSEGNIYFKQGLPGTKEAHCTSVINRIFSQNTPNLMSFSSELNRTLQKDFGSTLSDLYYATTDEDEHVKNSKYESIFQKVLCQWAHLQKSSVPLVHQLVSQGVPNYDQDWYINGLKEVFFYAKQKGMLSSEESKHLEECEVYVHETIKLWNKSGIPRTIVHGDLIESNVAMKSLTCDQLLFFDWEYMHIGYPYLDLQSSTHYPMFKNELIYLKCWTEYANLPTILNLARQSKPLITLTSVIADVLRITGEKDAIEHNTYQSNVRWNMKDFIQDVLKVRRQ